MADETGAKTASDRSLRILGLARNDIRWDQGSERYVGKLSNVFNSLRDRFDLIGMETARLSSWQIVRNRLLHFHLNRDRWRVESVMRANTIRQRSEAIERRLRKWDGRYDLIFQLHSMMAPGRFSANRRYVVCTDNTYAMSLQHWPEWVPNVSQSKHVEWMKRETEIYANAQYVFTWSEFARNSVISDYGISPDSVIATGAGANFTNASIKDKRYDTQIALFVGYEFERKGGKVLLDSWRDVHAALPDAKLYMVGPPDRSKIETPGVVWLGNVTDRAKLKGLYEQATVFVMPSIFEPWGHVFTEAMGMGLACVGNRSCAMPEIIDHDETGYLVPPGDTEALAECLIRVLSSTETAARFGRNAYNKMKSAGGWKDVIDVMSDYLVKATL